MKKQILTLGLMCAAAFALTNCDKQSTEPQRPTEGTPFEIIASAVDTKTANNGLKTEWVEGDALSVFYFAAGTTGDDLNNGTNDKFTFVTGSGNKFTSEIDPPKDGSYDWYAFYPYSSFNKTPAGTSKSNFGFTTIGGTNQTQSGNNSKAHLSGKSCPLYAVTSNVPSTATPSFKMKHLTSVVKVVVKNNSGADLTVNSVAFTGSEDIAGTYFVDFTGESPKYTNNSSSETATLNVINGDAIANGEEASFYIVIKPFTANSGESISLSVNGETKTKVLTSDVQFAAGKINALTYNVDSPIEDFVTIPWTEDFSENLSKYTLINGETGSETKTYNEKLAGGEAPELLIAKSNGSFSAKVKAQAGDFTLSFKTNKKDCLVVSTDNTDITITEKSKTEYTLSIPDGIDVFKLTITNANTTQNARIDDIALYVDNATPLATPVVQATLGSESTNSIKATWEAIEHAGSYQVTATPATGSAKSAEVTTTEYTFTGLAYETEYTISVVAITSDVTKYKDSEEGKSGVVKTGEKPASSWSIVSDVSTLKAGDIIRLQCDAVSKYAGPIGTGKFFTSVDSEDEAIEITLGGDASGWTLTTSEGTVGAVKAKQLSATSGTTTWTITIDADNNASITSTNSSFGTIKYNKQNPRFLNYASGQTAIQIYRK